MGISQVGEVPEQPPPFQPAKVEGDIGLAVNVTVVLKANLKEQFSGQLMPLGELVTVPSPSTNTVSSGLKLNVAVTVWGPLIVTTQVTEVPEQPPPLQPPNVDDDSGSALSVTVVRKS
jgi:hypothetical protein